MCIYTHKYYMDRLICLCELRGSILGGPGFTCCLLCPDSSYSGKFWADPVRKFPSRGLLISQCFWSHLIFVRYSFSVYVSYLMRTCVFVHMAYVLKPDWNELYQEQENQDSLRKRLAEHTHPRGRHTGALLCSGWGWLEPDWWRGKCWSQVF